MMNNKIKTRKLTLALAIAAALNSLSGSALAQENEEGETEVIEVTGIRSALSSALAEKRSSDNIKEVIQAEDIGKLPDSNLAEVLENITGVQIIRTAGVGTGVQIRGTDQNRVEINGVSTVGSGTGRGGVDFNDIPAALISSLEVIKVPDAKTIEGSVGGTINLRTLRGLSLDGRLTSVRIQAINSSIAESTTPKMSATFGDNWETDFGKVGVVLTGSYSRQDVTSLNPTLRRNRVNVADTNVSSEDYNFLRVQFLTQSTKLTEYETKNFNGSIEFAPTDNSKFYIDATINDQSKLDSNYTMQGSHVGNVANYTTNSAFETIDLGTIDGPNGVLDLGSAQAALTGILGTGITNSGGRVDPNLRGIVSSGGRDTLGTVLAIGGEWQGDKLKISSEVTYSSSESDFSGMNVNMDFINPKGPAPVLGVSIDNGTPFAFDTSGGILQWGVAQGLADSPSSQDLLTPENWALTLVGSDLTTGDNEEMSFRLDASYDISDHGLFFSDIDAGVRFSETSSKRNLMTTRSSYNNSSYFYRPTADMFADIAGPVDNNFNAPDDRSLFIGDLVSVDTGLMNKNPQLVIDTINGALTANNTAQIAAGNIITPYPLIDELTENIDTFHDITEETSALYLQGNFDFDVGDIYIRGNLGVRYVTTDVSSTGNETINGDVTQRTETGSNDFILPRFNITFELSDQLQIRAGVAKDISRPVFTDLRVARNWNGGVIGGVRQGNANLQPEKVTSFDLSAEYFFSDSAFVSVGLFHKKRGALWVDHTSQAVETEGADGQVERDITAPCEGGGIFNSTITNRGVWSSVEGVGICVPFHTLYNASGNETQTGIEIAAQYNLSDYEDELGWVSGFGLMANYTHQESGGNLNDFRDASGQGSALNVLLGRTDGTTVVDGERVFETATLDDDYVQERSSLLNLSEDSYNITTYYDKYGINARVRYTWRSGYRTNSTSHFNLYAHKEERGQLNASLSYDINETFTLGIEGVNLLREEETTWCVNDAAILCAQDFTDRKIALGVTANF